MPRRARRQGWEVSRQSRRPCPWYDFMMSNAIGALPHRATLVREDKERLTWLYTDHALGLSQWTGDEEDNIVWAVKTVSTKFNGHLMEYGMAPQVYNGMVQQLGGEKPETDVFASRHTPQPRKCTPTPLAQALPCLST